MASVTLTIQSSTISLDDIIQSAKEHGLNYTKIADNSVVVLSANSVYIQTWMSQYQDNIDIVMNYQILKFYNHAKVNTDVSINVSDITNPPYQRPWFLASELGKIYNFPTPTNQKVVVAIVSFGGGLYGNIDTNGVLTNGDVQAYWSQLNISPESHPQVIVLPIDGATNNPDINDEGATIENTIDVETIGALCPTNNLTIIVYLAPNNLSEFYNVLHNAIYNTVTINGQSYKPSIISVPWGAPEIDYSTTDLTNINTMLSYANSKGINICTASGNNGSNNGIGGTCSYADFPSSSPCVLSCGATSLICPNKIYDSQTLESAWTSGGGAISSVFPKPAYQTQINCTGRSTPDIAMNGDPNTGVAYIINNTGLIVGGSSVSAQIMTGYLASINSVNFVNPKLYIAPSKCIRDIEGGNNGSYTAQIGYDNCTGLGSIDGANLASVINYVPVISIALNSKTLNLELNQTGQIIATVLPLTATNQAITWVSNDTSIADVDQQGNVCSNALGQTSILVTTADGSKQAQCQITVNPISVKGISLNMSTATCQNLQTLQLVSTVVPVDAANPTISYISSDESIATIDQSGLIQTLNIGTVTLTVTANEKTNITASCELTVTSIPVDSIFINEQSSVFINDTVQLIVEIVPITATNKNIVWTSNNTDIATVDSNGLVTTVSVGEATITASSLDNPSITAIREITVQPIHVTNVTLSNSINNLIENQSVQLLAIIEPENATYKQLTWSSSNSEIATVTDSGLVSAKIPGNVTITATNRNVII